MSKLINPLAVIACKQKVGNDDTDAIALPVMIHLDAAKRGQCTGPGVNFLTTHLIIASYIASRTKSRKFHDQVVRAYAQLGKASARPTELLDLTTKEYAEIKAAFGTYLRAMPNVEVGVMSQACKVAEGMMA